MIIKISRTQIFIGTRSCTKLVTTVILKTIEWKMIEKGTSVDNSVTTHKQTNKHLSSQLHIL